MSPPKMSYSDENYYRKKVESDNWALTFDDVLCIPGYTDFAPEDVDIETKIGPYSFKVPIISKS